jgi:universal stress protein A
MSLYQHILLAVNLSPGSDEVAIKAKQLACHNQAKLSLVYVLDLPPVLGMGYEVPLDCDDSLNELLISNAELDLNTFIQHTQLDLHQTWLRQGDFVEEIVSIAQDNQVDLIIIGSHGKHGLALLLGSTANSVLHHARCDVLAVRLREGE